MSIKSNITDKSTGLSAEVVDGTEKNALVVATRPLKTYENKQQFFLNSDYGSNMNQDASASGTPDKVHDGTDSVLWTGSQITGGSDISFNNTDENHTAGGSKSVYFNRVEVNDTAQFAKGSDIDLTGYQSLTLWIYVNNNWRSGDSFSIYAWDSATSQIIGNVVYLEDYFDYSNYDVWQKISIPLIDMAIESSTTSDALRIQCNSISGTKPRFYIDDIEFEETGTPIIFTLTPNKGKWLHVENFMISIANDIASTVSDGTLPGIAYDSWLGETLITGLTYQRVQNNIVKSTAIIKTVGDWLSLPETEISSSMSDGTNTFLSMRGNFTDNIILKNEDDDELRIIVTDNLSGLLHLKISAGCKEEQR